MKVHVEYTGVLEVKDVPSGSDVELQEEATVGGLLNHLRIRPDHHRFIQTAVNGRQQRVSARLSDGDRVVLFLPMGGG